MHLGQRIRAGIALHAAVNIGFALAVVATSGSPGAVLVAPVDASVEAAVPAGDAVAAPTVTAPAPSGTTGALPPATTPSTAAAPTTSEPATTATTAPAPTTTATSAPTTATTTTVPTTPTSLASPGAGDRRRVVSTGYCIDGTTASGVPAGPGHAAMNDAPFGSRWMVHDGPFPGTVYEVTDRIAGEGSEFDIWFDTCDEAFSYGRRTITIERLA